jgi:hypothetical protein
MNQSEIRDRVREALGEAAYPPALNARLQSRLAEPAPRTHPRAIGYAAAILAILIIGTLVFTRFQMAQGPVPSTGPSATAGPVNPDAQLPEADLSGANLSGAAAYLVTPFNLVAQSSGRTVTLIGAYADTARTVLFFRSMPAGGYAAFQVYDQQGLLNAGGGGGLGSVGDQWSVLDMGPHVGSDGLAHLTVTMFDIASAPPSMDHLAGDWRFSVALKVQPSTSISLSPALTSVGSWKVNVEAAEITPTVVHFQAVINGVPPSDVGLSTVTLVDSAGQPVPSAESSISIAVQHQQPSSTRIDLTWARPHEQGTYQLRIAGGGSEYQGSVDIPAPAAGKLRKGNPIVPSDFPLSAQAIDLEGAFTASVIHGNPSQCGAGAGASGPIFAFAAWFQADNAWYLIVFSTDPAVSQYLGPGTYTAKAVIEPYAPYGADPIFAGTVQLTVMTDKGPDTGSVRGTLSWTGSASQPVETAVGGTWSCTPGPALGPG